MAGQVGRVFSDRIMEALIRRGENRYASGGGIRRSTTTQYAEPSSGRSNTTREERLNRQLDLEEARASRGEALDRERFEEQKRVNSAAIARGEAATSAAGLRAEAAAEAKRIGNTRDVNQLIATIGRLRQAQHRTDPNTLEVPKGQAEAIEQLIQVAMGQLTTLLGPEGARRALAAGNPFGPGTLPPQRAGAAPGPAVQQGAPSPTTPLPGHPPGAPAAWASMSGNPFEVGDEEADAEIDDLIPGIPR